MSGKLARVTCTELVRALTRAGFEKERQRGSHLHLYRRADGRRLTVPCRKGRTVPVGTLHAILRDADLSVDQFRELL
ncbi:MAG: hypothetical protein COZ06_05725 [Armatimonadetes bacterium CG_4_10_14_3_um_filter_66_18]|nr:addiction module toxin, HicA family [Armatimonadota bacterium]OIO98632.1 MAG: hypothetical protein AUJ96_20820 [Armatimonadetes bacterium CG2_30_66_41]PIX41153.1 MAG: hypothetical protein COZ57_24145 [Armatimonadetes bacterium CG_4_8_14_3_um_filter_66_20]PIY51144.1 MAG: hypothetical protein COZ06_05725 [Armatimonadetes bacterium CG_4_10_14_3_um_filter_66_18]NCO95770.1 addiction module toxin, HicA family [Armatimonadota bacterium]